MTPEEQMQLFGRFAQASPKTYAEFGGSGLGLFISKRLVELQGGDIMVESEKGEGTKFTFHVHCERNRGMSGPVEMEGVEMEAAEKAKEVKSSLPSTSLLEDMEGVEKAKMEMEGVTVPVAAEGAGGLSDVPSGAAAVAETAPETAHILVVEVSYSHIFGNHLSDTK